MRPHGIILDHFPVGGLVFFLQLTHLFFQFRHNFLVFFFNNILCFWQFLRIEDVLLRFGKFLPFSAKTEKANHQRQDSEHHGYLSGIKSRLYRNAVQKADQHEHSQEAYRPEKDRDIFFQIIGK